jgi:hypothetical protein
MKKFKLKKECGICGSKDFLEILDLGAMPPANAFLKANEFKKEENFPLVVQLCKNCKSLQLRHVVSPIFLFKDYCYTTRASQPLVEHFHELAEEIVNDYVQSPNDLVVEIGSNDGVLLSKIKDQCKVLGIDPANNIAKTAIQENVPTLVDFFNTKLSKKIKSDIGEAKVVVANNVMAHINDLRDVFSGVKHLLSSTGCFIFEVHWVGNLLTEGGFDQIYHEHLYYHSLNSLKVLLDSLGMVINNIRLVPIHGQSMRVYVGRSGVSSSAVRKFLDREIKMGLLDAKTYQNFSKKVESNKGNLSKLLGKLKKNGKKIVGYGAPAKGNTLLNYFKIEPKVLDYITDTTPSKQGKYTPGAHIPIVSPEKLESDWPDYALLLSWNYADAILKKEKALREKGLKFIVPVPKVKIV